MTVYLAFVLFNQRFPNSNSISKDMVDILQKCVNFVGPYTEGEKLFSGNPQISQERIWFEDEFFSQEKGIGQEV